MKKKKLSLELAGVDPLIIDQSPPVLGQPFRQVIIRQPPVSAVALVDYYLARPR